MTCTQASFLANMALVSSDDASAVKTGLDSVYRYRQLFAGQRIGIIANQTAQDARGRFIVDVLEHMPGTEIVALFAPEHGLWGSQAAGENVNAQMHPTYRIPVYSLYGRGLQSAKPSPSMLKDVDLLIFDIQDIGARFYTYIWTMALSMEAAAETNTRFIVLDRPNPIGGIQVKGNILDMDYSSFVGLHPIPVVHGMTVGELARLINGQGWLGQGVQADLHVIPMLGWQRRMLYDETGLPFIRPSPNIPDLDTALIYPGMALLEGTNVSEGRGTPLPFKQFGAPWIDSRTLHVKLNSLTLPGLRFEQTEFTPRSSKHQKKRCQGIRIHITERRRLDPYFTGIQIIKAVYDLHKNALQWRDRHFDRLCGTASVRRAIINDTPLTELRGQWQGPLNAFLRLRERYLIY